MEYALITGASKGIGKALAYELAKRGHNLLLIARTESLLIEIEKDIQEKFQVKAHSYAIDLSLPDAPKKIVHLSNVSGYTINILVNNAGFGLWGPFDELPIEEQLDIMRLNMSALVALTYHVIPVLKKHKESYILNVGSVAAHLAIPTFSIYAASKAFVLSFSRSLHKELAKDGIKVSCVSPGATESEFLERAGMAALNEKADQFNMTAEHVAQISINGMFKGKSEIIPGFINKVAVGAITCAPKSIVESVAGRIYEKRDVDDG